MNHFLSQEGFHQRTNEIISYEEFISRIKFITSHFVNPTIGKLDGRKSNPTTLFWIEIPKLGMFRVHADSKLNGLVQLMENDEPRVVISKRGSKVLSTCTIAIAGVYIYLEE